MRALTRVAAMLALLLAAACMTDSGEYEAAVSQTYAIAADATPECVAAAKRATRWCAPRKDVSSDSVYSQYCTDAKWDYARNCR